MDILEAGAAGISGTATLVTAWMLVKGRIKSLEDKAAEHATSIADHGQRLNVIEKSGVKVDARLDRLEEKVAESVQSNVFDERMRSQDDKLDRHDDKLDRIEQAVQGKANKTSLSTMQRVDPREEMSTPMPPMRPRLPSRRGPGE